jgi:hypothetical protein
MRTFKKASVVILSLGLVFAACGDDDDASDETSTTSTTAATTTTTAALSSDSAMAKALDGSILSGQQVQATLKLSAEPTEYKGTDAAPPPPQGPLSQAGIIKVYPEAYKGLLEQSTAKDGANKTFLMPQGFVVNILAVKFPTVDAGGAFVKGATDLATTFAGGKTTAHSEVTGIGTLPVAVLRVPPQAPSTNETVVVSALYDNGVYYQISATAPPNAVPDELLIGLLKAQNAKYQAAKASIPTS